MRSNSTGLAVAILAMTFCVQSWAINKCIDKSGKVSYQEHPCSNSDTSSQKVNTAPAVSSGADDAAGQERLAKIKHDNAKFDAMMDGRVMRGMSQEQVRNAWGNPSKINKSIGSYGVHEQWVYERGRGGSQYIYFENGAVSSMQSPQ